MSTWPALPFAAWKDTCETLHLWTQVIGKLALRTTARQNHWWNLTLHYTATGLATLPMRVPRGRGTSRGENDIRTLVGSFDFVAHRVLLQASDGRSETIALEPMTVAAFHAKVVDALARMQVDIPITTKPAEMPDGIPFDQDTVHRSYDAAYVNAFWRALEAMRPVLEDFRCGFVGKCSPVHFFWGGFDLAVTRFSGRRAPPRPGADAMMQEAYSHEVISHGFWPGGRGYDALFYAYAAPEPEEFARAAVRPAAASYSTELKEFILPYEAVRSASNPAAELRAFLETTYEAAADLARWPRNDLER